MNGKIPPWGKYIEILKNMKNIEPCDKKLLISRSQNNSLEEYYAPFDYINYKAKVVLIGITPGHTQAKEIHQFIKNQPHGRRELLMKEAKYDASFSGEMRNNLIRMLNQIGLSKALDINNCEELFNNNRELLHATSLFRYPLFTKEGKGYNGYVPSIIKIMKMFSERIDSFISEIKNFEKDLIIIPLGSAVSKAVKEITKTEHLKEKNILTGFPHPTPRNVHRLGLFDKNKSELIQKINTW